MICIILILIVLIIFCYFIYENNKNIYSKKYDLEECKNLCEKLHIDGYEKFCEINVCSSFFPEYC